MWNTTPTDGTLHLIGRAGVAAILLFAAAACSQPGEAAAPVDQTPPAATEAPSAAQNPATTPPEAGTSRVLGKRDFTLRGKPACDIDFVYAGMEPEDLFWEEPCAAVTARMMTQQDLEALNDWDPLDSFDKQFVNALPNGQVLYVSGTVSASIYPVNTTGLSYEVSVSD